MSNRHVKRFSNRLIPLASSANLFYCFSPFLRRTPLLFSLGPFLYFDSCKFDFILSTLLSIFDIQEEEKAFDLSPMLKNLPDFIELLFKLRDDRAERSFTLADFN